MKRVSTLFVESVLTYRRKPWSVSDSNVSHWVEDDMVDVNDEALITWTWTEPSVVGPCSPTGPRLWKPGTAAVDDSGYLGSVELKVALNDV